MPQYTEPLPNGMLCRVISDEDAPPNVDALVAGMRSSFLTSNVATPHKRGSETVLMRDHINLLLTLEYPGSKLVSFIMAELEHEARLARLHIIYVLRLYRGRENAKMILEQFDSLIAEAGYTTVVTAPTNHRSLKIITAHQAESGLEYRLVVPSEAELSAGDRAPD